MKATVQAQWNAAHSDAALEKFAGQVRASLNAVYRPEPFDLTTAATATLTAIWTSPDLAQGARVNLQVYVTGSNADGTVYATYKKEAQYYRATGGSTALQGSVADLMTPRESDAGLDCDFNVSGNAVEVRVNDGGVDTVDWKAWIEARTA